MMNNERSAKTSLRNRHNLSCEQDDLPPIFVGIFTDRNVFIGALIIFVLFFCISLPKMGSFTGDEVKYHYPNMENYFFNGLGATFNSQYSAANTPLPYIITSFVAHLTALNLFVARMTTALISFGIFWVVFALLKAYSAPRYASLIFLFSPYFFLNSFIFYANNYGILFMLLAFLVMWQTKGKAAYISNFLTGIFLALAVLCQQFYLLIPAAIAAYRLGNAFQHRREDGQPQFKSVIGSLVAMNIPLLLPLYIFSRWGGLTHPNFQYHSLGFYPSTIVGILFVTGLYYFPFLLLTLRKATKAEILVGGLLSILLVVAFRPQFSSQQGAGIFVGLTNHMISLTGKMGGIFPVVVMIGLVFCGIQILVRLFRDLSMGREYMLFLAALLLAIVYVFNTLIGERHLIGYITILFLLVLPRIRGKIGLLYLAAMACLGISYYIYYIFFKFASI
jgi:hypothetical protein